MTSADPDRIFIDKNIPGGALWEQHIREKAVSFILNALGCKTY